MRKKRPRVRTPAGASVDKGVVYSRNYPKATMVGMK